MNIIDSSYEIWNQDCDFISMQKQIEKAGKVCYKSENNITEDSYKSFVERMIKSKHHAMLEHGTVYLYEFCETNTDHFADFINLIEKYKKNPYSKVVVKTVKDNDNNLNNICHAYITTNYRVIIENGWESDLKYITKEIYDDFEKRITVHFILDCGIGREFTRHRVFSFAQESTRYCLAGDTKLKFSNPHTNFSISDLYNNMLLSKNGAWKRMKIRQIDNNGNLIYSKIKKIFYNGKQKVYELTTKLGYVIKCTKNHELYTADGYKELQNICIGDKIYINGITCDSKELYKNYDWIYHQNITLNKTFVEISKEFNFNVNTLKKWARKLNIPKKGTGYFNIGRIPWNKNLSEQDDDRVKKQTDALRKYHHCGRRNDKILKHDTSDYQKYKKDACFICNTTENLEVHHIDKNHNNNNPENLITLCETCHSRIHNKNLDIIALDEVVSIKECGEEDVFDISMCENENFVANGIIVHNCSYNKDKFGNEITFIKPFWYGTELTKKKDYAFLNLCEEAEKAYLEILNVGGTAQEAREVLPLATKSELVMTGFINDWKHFFDLRAIGTTGAPHPGAKKLASPLMKDFQDIKLI